MNKLALTLPGFSPIPGPSGLNRQFVDLGSMLTPLLEVALYAAAFLAFGYLVWGAFDYINARGNKENLAKARARITWAIAGLMVVITAYLIATFAAEIFPPTTGGVTF